MTLAAETTLDVRWRYDDEVVPEKLALTLRGLTTVGMKFSLCFAFLTMCMNFFKALAKRLARAILSLVVLSSILLFRLCL